jgi:hypothetical protein
MVNFGEVSDPDNDKIILFTNIGMLMYKFIFYFITYWTLIGSGTIQPRQ